MPPGAWGKAPIPLVPHPLRQAWKALELPTWLCDELRLEHGANIAALDSSIWVKSEAVSDRVLNAIATMLHARIRDVADLSCVSTSAVPPGVSLLDAELSQRSRNSLTAAGLLKKPAELALRTYGDLLNLPRVGVRSAIEIACVLEWAIETQTAVVNQASIVVSGESPQADWLETLIKANSEPWIDQITRQDPRFRQLMPNGSGSLQERIEKALAEVGEKEAKSDGMALARAIPGIELRVAQISVLKLEDALGDVLASYVGKNPQHVAALTARFGWSGSPPKTLQECASPLGVTRERVRQIESRARERLEIRGAFLPQLDAAIQCLEETVPIPAKLAAAKLQEAGICVRPFSIESLLSAANVFGRATSLTFTDLPQGKIVLGHPEAAGALNIARTARRVAGRSGIANVFQVADELLEYAGESEVPHVRQLLQGLENFEFVNEDWFWVTDQPVSRNRLRNMTRKMLSVASPQTVASVRDGLKRGYSFVSKSHAVVLAVPPMEVIRAYFIRSPEFKLEGGVVSSVKSLDYDEVLGSVEAALVGLFRTVPSGVLDRRSVVEGCVQRGLNESTVQTFLTYSPILEHVDLDAWKLRGIEVNPAALEALREANQTAPRGKRVLSFGWSPAGRLWIASRLPYSLVNVVVGVPGPLRRYLVGRSFTAFDRTSAQSCGTVSVNAEGTSYGYGPFIRRSGADSEDVLHSEFDLQRDTVHLSMADEFALEEDSSA